MNELSIFQIFGLFVALFLLGKVTSTAVYQLCWRNALGRDLQRFGSTTWLLTRWRLWPIHALIIGALGPVTWIDFPTMRMITLGLVCLMGWATIFRFSAVDKKRFFIADRFLVVVLAISTWFSPIWLYPFLMVCCCLQYVVASSPLGPGYSNLLGFEFNRGTSCVVLTGLLFAGVCQWMLATTFCPEPLLLSVILGVQASYYVNHALAKSWLGPKWYSWIIHNRVECLIVNSFLRGWAARLGKDRILHAAKQISRVRVLVCGAMWTLEFAFVAILIDPRYAVILFGCATVFHIGVWILTGLAEMEHIVNHVGVVALLLLNPTAVSVSFGPWILLASFTSMLLAIVWVGTLRISMHRGYELSGDSRWSGFADPFDHLMAWWDSPLMRMFTFVVTTNDGKQWSLPVTKLSPYDTAVTDIHTHIMILHQHPDFDREVNKDKQSFRTGVWGLVVTIAERDALYAQMKTDELKAEFVERVASVPAPPWIFPSSEDQPIEAGALQSLFAGFNAHLHRGWFRLVMRYPHFPGEDLVPDVCPLVTQIPEYVFDRPISSVLIRRIKTFYTGDQIHLLEQSDVGIIHLE